jgi:septal ring factor EnvC (AmiA/AmiB activator)
MCISGFRKITFFVVILLGIIPLGAQSVKELEQQRKQTLQLLESTNKMLNETKKSQRSSLNKLTIINKNIDERKNLIKNISVEINSLDAEMTRLNQETQNLNNKLSGLKADYAKLVQEAHVHRSIYTKIMFVLSAKTFDQSYRRYRYLQEYSNYRKQQVQQIERVKTQIAQKTDSVSKHKNTRVEVITQKEVEAKKLTNDQQKEKVFLNDLNKKESKLRSDLRIQQKKANDLNNKIERLIAEEIRKAEAKRKAEEQQRLAEERRLQEEERKRKAAQVNKKEKKEKNQPVIAKAEKDTSSPRPSSGENTAISALTREETLISGNFSSNRGRLPWPASNGFISGHYGVQVHPVLKHVTTNNKGIYIQTTAGSNARAVFDGTVTQRFSIPGSNNAVIVQHGEYRTVYANLTSIYVNVGDKISAKQSIGKIYTDNENDNKTELYFQVWKGKTLQNPESWIAK